MNYEPMLRSTYDLLFRRKEMYEREVRNHYLKDDKREKKEERINLIRAKAREISTFLKNSRIIEKLEITGGFVMVGTLCRLVRLDGEGYIDFVVLGCADIKFNPKHRNDVSYQSRLGLKLIGKTPEMEVEIRGKRYRIEKIFRYQE